MRLRVVAALRAHRVGLHLRALLASFITHDLVQLRREPQPAEDDQCAAAVVG